MSGIYIPGLAMPKSCCECFAFKSNADGYLFCKAKRIAFGKEDAEWLPLKTPNWCPLVPVPEHGRLNDADALAEHKFVCVPHVTIDGKEAGYAYRLGWNAAIEAIIENAETIIKGDE